MLRAYRPESGEPELTGLRFDPPAAHSECNVPGVHRLHSALLRARQRAHRRVSDEPLAPAFGKWNGARQKSVHRRSATNAPATPTASSTADHGHRLAGHVHPRGVQRGAHPDDPQRVRRRSKANPSSSGRHRTRAIVCQPRFCRGSSPSGRAQGRERSSGCGANKGSQPRQLQVLRESERQVGVHQATPRGCGPHAPVALRDGRRRTR